MAENSENNENLIDFDKELLSKTDDYGENSYPDVATKLDYAERACDLLGVDFKKVSLIILTSEASRTCYRRSRRKILKRKGFRF